MKAGRHEQLMEKSDITCDRGKTSLDTVKASWHGLPPVPHSTALDT